MFQLVPTPVVNLWHECRGGVGIAEEAVQRGWTLEIVQSLNDLPVGQVMVIDVASLIKLRAYIMSVRDEAFATYMMSRPFVVYMAAGSPIYSEAILGYARSVRTVVQEGDFDSLAEATCLYQMSDVWKNFVPRFTTAEAFGKKEIHEISDLDVPQYMREHLNACGACRAGVQVQIHDTEIDIMQMKESLAPLMDIIDQIHAFVSDDQDDDPERMMRLEAVSDQLIRLTRGIREESDDLEVTQAYDRLDTEFREHIATCDDDLMALAKQIVDDGPASVDASSFMANPAVDDTEVEGTPDEFAQTVGAYAQNAARGLSQS